ncbi:MAG TPA: YegS/Rv2252/BmrU family lipid kinase [Candidatus Thermoplasmatota archaeon]|nr:YegS/Rv2252/BmrU family lipid kinase [Candidatus Thermoplasmatota archaeon]
MALPLIFNPAAGHGRGAAAAKDVQARLQKAGVAAELVPTERPGHATLLAARLAETHDRVGVVGGDGTVSEAARGVLDLPPAQRPTLACFPAGTGNDFLRDFGILRVQDAVGAVAAGSIRATDAVSVTCEGSIGNTESHTWSLNVVGTGLMATAAERANRDWKWMGRKGYDVAAAIEILRNRPSPTRLDLDGERADGDYPLVAACNSVHTGGAMRLAPEAQQDDGLLDVVTCSQVGPAELLALLATKVRPGRHVEHPKVQVRRARDVYIAPATPTAVNVDGEIAGRTPVRLRVHARALRIAAPSA